MKLDSGTICTDINAGCWVKKIAKRGAGAGLLLDPPYLQKMVEEIVNIVDICNKARRSKLPISPTYQRVFGP